MIAKLINYIKEERKADKEKVSFFIPKVILLVSIIVAYFWGESLGEDKNIYFWIFFSFIVIFGITIMSLSYFRKKTD